MNNCRYPIADDSLRYDGTGRSVGKRHLNGGTTMVGFTSAYDKSSHKYFERALHADSRSSLYSSYDSMNRLLAYQRGTLASGGGSISTAISLPGTDQQRSYDLDGLRNWTDTVYTPEGGSLTTETRTHNKLKRDVLLYLDSPNAYLYTQCNPIVILEPDETWGGLVIGIIAVVLIVIITVSAVLGNMVPRRTEGGEILQITRVLRVLRFSPPVNFG